MYLYQLDGLQSFYESDKFSYQLDGSQSFYPFINRTNLFINRTAPVRSTRQSDKFFYKSGKHLYINPKDTPKMTKSTETTICPKIAINGQDPTTERIKTAYTFLLGWLVKKGKTCSPVGWAGILTTPLEWTLLQGIDRNYRVITLFSLW